jgi:hypothetical protein
MQHAKCRSAISREIDEFTLCGEQPTITGLIDYEPFCGMPPL